MPDKQARIETIIKKNLTEIIQFKVADPNIGFHTITDVKVSKDFSYATILVSFFLEKDRAPGMKALNHAKGFIRTELSKTIDIRRCPELRFELDDGYDKELAIEKALKGENK